ncbi:MAG: O-antigen ligase family protein [Anaerolineae bacterium]
MIALGVGLALLPLKWAGAGVAAAAVFVTILVRPKLGLYLLIPAIPFSSLLQIPLGGASVGPVEALLALMLAAWLAHMAARRAIVIPHPPLLWPFLLFLGAVGASWAVTFSLTASLIETLKWLEMLALYLFMAAHLTRRDVPPLAAALLLGGLAQAAPGLYQFLFKAGPEGFLLFEGRFLRAFGTFRQPNPYAGYLGLILPLALSVTLWGAAQLWGGKRRSAGLWTAFGGATLALLLAALFASQSRGAWIGFAVAAVVTVLLAGEKWAAALTAALVAAAIVVSMGGLALLPQSISQRFAGAVPYIGLSDVSTVAVTDANFAAIERLAHWQAARDMWRDHLWLGVGFGNYQTTYPVYAVGRWLDPLGHAHNYLLNIGAEAGLVGVLGYLVFWVWVAAATVKHLRRAPPGSFQRAVITGGLGIMAHLHLHNMVDNLYVQGMYLHVSVIFGLMTLVQNSEKSYRN